MNHQDYRDTLKQEFLRRSQARSSYSLRAFARDLELSPSRVSDLFQKKTHLSLRSAERVASKLAFNIDEKTIFCRMVEASSSKSETNRKRAQQELSAVVRAATKHHLSNENFTAISDWYFLALIELAAKNRLTLEHEKTSRQLGLPLMKTRTAIDQLCELGYLVRKDDRYEATHKSLFAGDRGASRAIQNFHDQLLKVAREKLITVEPSKRDFNARYLSLSEDQYEELKSKMKQWLEEAAQVARPHSSQNVYAVAVQIFPLTNNGETSK